MYENRTCTHTYYCSLAQGYLVVFAYGYSDLSHKFIQISSLDMPGKHDQKPIIPIISNKLTY